MRNNKNSQDKLLILKKLCRNSRFPPKDSCLTLNFMNITSIKIWIGKSEKSLNIYVFAFILYLSFLYIFFPICGYSISCIAFGFFATDEIKFRIVSDFISCYAARWSMTHFHHSSSFNILRRNHHHHSIVSFYLFIREGR